MVPLFDHFCEQCGEGFDEYLDVNPNVEATRKLCADCKTLAVEALAMLKADPNRWYHRRISNTLINQRFHKTACGTLVDYQQTMGSWDDINCPKCLAEQPTITIEE